MKTFVLFTCVLTVATIVYGANQEEVVNIHGILDECSKELNTPKEFPTVEVIICVARKEGTILDEHDMPIMHKVMDKLDRLISDPIKLEKARGIAQKCITDAQKAEGTVKEKGRQVTECVLPIVGLLDSKI